MRCQWLVHELHLIRQTLDEALRQSYRSGWHGSNQIFDYGITQDSATLRSGRINPEPFNPPHRGLFELLRGRGVNIIAGKYPRHTKLIKIQIRSLNRLLSVVCGTWLRVCASAPAAGTPITPWRESSTNGSIVPLATSVFPYAVSVILGQLRQKENK